MRPRLIRIDERSAAGDPLEEFPKGNSLWRLQGAFVFPSLLHTLDTICHGRWRAFDHSSSVILLCAGARFIPLPVPRCAVRCHSSAISKSWLYV
jgi:hypothetical protein